MKGLVVATCLCWLLASVGITFQTLSECAGQTLTYHVESTVLSGIPEYADQYSGLSILYRLKVDVVSKNKALFKIQDVLVGKLNEVVPVSYADDIPFQHSPAPLYEKELSKPILVHFDESQVTKFEAQKSDPMWSVNVKRALIEKFQVDLKKQNLAAVPAHSNYVPSLDPKASMYSVYEEGIGGECETRYSLLSVQSLDHPDMSGDVLNVTKVKNYRNCRSRPVFEYDNFQSQGCPSVCEPKHAPLTKKPQIWRESSSAYESGCPFGFEPDHHPVKSYSIVKYNISHASHAPLIDGILAEGKTTYNLFGKEIMVIAQQNITLLKKSSLRSELPSVSNPVTYESLEFQLPEEDYLDPEDSNLYAIYGPLSVPDLIRATVRGLESVVDDIIPTEPETSKLTGGKVVQLVNAVKVLKRPELEIVYQQLVTEKMQKVPRKKELMRKVFLDLLAIAADDETALFVRDLIVAKRAEIWEAAELVEGIGKNSDEPSQEVLDAYIKLLERPRVQQSRRLLPALGIAVGKMVYDTCVEENDPQQHQYLTKQKVSPAKSAKKMSEESSQESQEQTRQTDEESCTPEQLKTYVKTIAKKLQEAKDIHKMVAYIETLAHTGSALALPYLQPYVTGEASNADALDDEDTDFLRQVTIYTLHHLAGSNPDQVLPLVANIYFDPSEDYDIRISAFSVLMKTQPPLTMIERILTDLHDEVNNQVGSYVYSLLSDLANSTLPCDRKLAQKIQLVFAHAPDFDIGMQYSDTYQYTLYDDDNDYGLRAESEYIVSNVSTIPRSFYTSMNIIRGPFRDGILEVGGVVKGMDELLDKLLEPSGILSQIISSFGSNVQVRNVHQVLDIVKNRLLFTNQDSDTPRAALYYKLFGRTSYLSLDEQYVVELLEQAVQFFREIDSTSGFTGEYVKVWMPSSFFRVVPSTVGLPVVVNHRNPIIFTISVGNSRLATTKNKQDPLKSTFALSTDIDASFHLSRIVLAYVVDSVEDKIRGAAIEKTSEVAFASQLEVVLDLQKETYALSLKPKLPHELFYHNTRPSTFVGDATISFIDRKEDWLGHDLEIETVPELFKFEERKEARPLGLSLRLVGESDNPFADLPITLSDTANEDGIVAAFVEMVVNPEITNREFHVYLEPHRKNPVSEILFTVDYDKHLKMGLPKEQEEVDKESSSSEEEEYEKAVSSIYGRSYSVPDAQTTIEKLVKKTQATWAPILGQGYSDPVPATVIHVVDMTLEVKADHVMHHAWRTVYAHSLDFRSNWFEVVGHRSTGGQERPWQFCSSLVAVYPEMPNPFYMEMNTLKSQKAKFEAEVGWGVDCQKQNHIQIEGEMLKSEQQLTTSSGVYQTEKDQQSLPWYYKQCQVDRRQGRTQSYACQEAISEDADLNVIKMDIIAPSLPYSLQNLSYQLDLTTKYALYYNLEANPYAHNPHDRLSLELHYSEQVPEMPLIDLYVHKPTESLAFTKLYVPMYEPPSTLDTYDEVLMDQYYDGDYTPECNLMEDYLSTFDNVTIELPDNKCQYILAHDCSPDKAYTIIASQIDLQAKTKALSMSLAGHTLKAMPPRGTVVPVVINGKEHELVPRKPVVLDFYTETELRVYVRLTSSSTDTPILVVEAVDDDITVEYDGKNARIQLPRDFQGDQCGMCGDFNDEEFQEFVGPNGCLYVEEEDFANSYAVPGQSCPEPPKPQGPAFCPSDVTYQPKPQKQKKEETVSSEEQEPVHKRHHPKHLAQDSTETVHKKHHTRKPSSDEYSEETPKHKKVPRISQETDDNSQENVKPSGREDCIQTYTEVIEDAEGSEEEEQTCFSVLPVHRCHPACRALRPQPQEVPFHCLTKGSKHERVLKEQAKRGVLHQLRHKKADLTRNISVPEKCI